MALGYKPFMKRRGGVTRIVVDTYGTKSQSWWAIAKEVRQRDQHKCQDCGLLEDPKNGINHDVHHIKPLSKGGRTVMLNLILLCKNHHAARHKHLR